MKYYENWANIFKKVSKITFQTNKKYATSETQKRPLHAGEREERLMSPGSSEILGKWYQMKVEDIEANDEHSLGHGKMCGFLF